jgi:hypothetical protein
MIATWKNPRAQPPPDHLSDERKKRGTQVESQDDRQPKAKGKEKGRGKKSFSSHLQPFP